MKMAIVLDVDSPSWLQQAQEINLCMSQSGFRWNECALWLLFTGNKPTELPVFEHAVSQVFWLKVQGAGLTESSLLPLIQAYQHYPAQLLLFGGNISAIELAVRTAHRLGGASCSDVHHLQIEGDQCLIQQPCYANNMMATLSLITQPWCIAVARQGGSELDTAPYSGQQADVNTKTDRPDWLIEKQVLPTEDVPVLDKASRILAIGQGVGNEGNVEALRDIANALRAELAASRPVVMSAWCPMNRLIGMSGASVAPDVCIVAGISGAPAFSVGIRHSRLVVAINSDPEAAIFSQADVGIVGDMHQALDELVKCCTRDT